MKKRFFCVLLVLLIVLSVAYPIISFGNEEKQEKVIENDTDENIGNSFNENYESNEDQEEEKYTEEYKKWLELSDEERAKCEVIPRKYNVPFSALYEDEESKPITSINNLRKNVLVKASQEEELPKSFVLFKKEKTNIKCEKYGGIEVPVRDQTPYNLCGIFASIKCLETNLALNKKGDFDFSEMHVNYLESEEFGKRYYLDGAHDFYAFEDYLKNLYGPVLEEEVPYDTKYTIDEYDYLLNLSKSAYVNNTVHFPSLDKKNNNYSSDDLKSFRDKVKQHIIENGSIYCTTCFQTEYDINYNPIGNDTLKFKDGKYVLNYQGEAAYADHAISIIGWDDGFSKDNFPENYKPQNDGAYIAINSWGEEENGFKASIIYISYEDIFVEKDMHGIVGASTVPEEAMEKLQFEDENLYNEIKKLLDGKVAKSDDSLKTLYVSKLVLENIISLNLANKNITNLNGIEKFTKLSFIELNENNIENIECLSDFQNDSMWINLDNNDINDVSALSNFTSISISGNRQIKTGLEKLNKVESLTADSCALTNEQICELSELPIITYLSLKNNDITDVSSLRDLNNLCSLELSGNKNISGLQELTNLNFLNLSDCSLGNSSLESLKNLNNLRSLNLANNKITDASELKNLNIYELILSGNKGVKLNTIPVNLNSEEEIEYSLNLDDCNIQDISDLEGTNISSISLANNPITDLTPIKDNENIRTINLANTGVSDVSYLNKIWTIILNGNKGLINLDKLEGVRYLELNECNINDFSFINNLTNLYSIVLENNDINEFTQITNNNILNINLSNNKLTSFPDFSDLRVYSINLANNEIEDISNIESMINLNDMYCNINLSNNKIEQVPEIYNEKLSINVKNNPLTDVSENYNGEFCLAKTTNYDLEINKDNRIKLDGIFKKENENRYRNQIKFITENCSVDNKNDEIIIHPTELGEGQASITIESDSWRCNSKGSKLTINYETKEKINIDRLEMGNSKYKEAYIEGDNFDNSNLVIKAIYENGLEYTITDYKIENGENLQLGQKTVRITYEGKEYELPIVVYSNDNYDITFSEGVYSAIRELLSRDIVYSDADAGKIRCIVTKEGIDNLTHLIISNINFGYADKADYTGLSKLHNLKELELNENNIYNQQNFFEEICQLEQLEQLRFNKCWFDDSYSPNTECITEVIKLSNLQCMDLGETRVTSGGWIEDRIFYLPKYLTKDEDEKIEIKNIYKNNNDDEIEDPMDIYDDKDGRLYIIVNTKYPYEKKENNVNRGLARIIISKGKIIQKLNYYYDWNQETEKPTVKITAEPLNEENTTDSDSVTYTFTWNEKVYGFTKDSITVENGVKGEFTEVTPNKEYTLVVTNNVEEGQEGTQKITVNENVCEDLASNGNEKAEKEITIKKEKQNEIINGDINGNGEIDPNDYIAILRHIAAQTDSTKEKWILSEEEQQLADVKKDGIININDVIKLKRYIAAKNDENVATAHPGWLEL